MSAVIESDNRIGLERPMDRVAHLASRVALPLALGIALVVRVLLIARAPGILDGDEALVGIQAQRIAASVEHPLPVFFYGQPYMGTLEAYLVAGLFRLVGPSVPALRLAPLFFALLLVALTYELARRVAGHQAAGVAALLAALPPLYVDNVYTRGATFGYRFGGSPGHGSSPTRVAGVATYFVNAVVPKLAGAWEPWVAANSRPLGAIVLALYALSALYLVVRLLAGWRGMLGYRGRPRHGQGLLLAFAGVVAVLFCVSGFGATALNPYGFDAASRYALPLAGVLPVAAGALLWRLWRLWAPLGAAALAVLLLANATGYALARPGDVFQSEYWAKLPPTEAPLALFLERHGIRYVWMNHWAGYPLMFYADGPVTAADYNDVVLHHGPNRLPWAMR